MQEGRLFALELRAYPGFEALQEHLGDAHPRCDFCSRRFYDDDGLWKHMQQVWVGVGRGGICGGGLSEG